MAIVLVLDGEQRAALAATRSLGRAGHEVHVASAVMNSLAGGSRHARSEIVVPDPLNDPQRFAKAIAGEARSIGATVVLPITEPSTLALLEQPAPVAGLIIPGADLARFRQASDKEAVLRLAPSVGIDAPAQWTFTADQPVPRIPEFAFPVVIKPSRSVVGAEGQRRKTNVRYAEGPEELARVVAHLGLADGPLLVQARVEGPGVGVFLLRWNGVIHAQFAHRRLREKPPSGGVSVCCESVAPPADLLRRSADLLAVLDWQGVAMIEFKQDARSGRYFLMEINPRFWGSLQLAIDAGVDFPAMLVGIATGAPVAPIPDWKVGIRSRWCWGEVDHLIARLRRTDAELHLPAGSPSRWRTALSVLLPWRPRTRSDVWRWSDPLPAWREMRAWFGALSNG